jgi:aminobenzoyl-glutamate utilization protein B
MALQELMDAEKKDGLETEVAELRAPPEEPQSGGSDDIGDVSWNVPTITLRFPSNVDMQGHHWSSAMAMATPIAHKGAVAGAKAIAATMLDLIQDESLVEDAWTYFNDVQTADEQYVPFIADTDDPAIEKNAEIMSIYKERLRALYYDPSQYDTYLEQLGIEYPQLTDPDATDD